GLRGRIKLARSRGVGHAAIHNGTNHFLSTFRGQASILVTVHSVLTKNTDVAKPQALAVRDMYAEGCRVAVLDRGGSASQSEITIGPTSPSTGRGSPRHHAGPWRGRCLRRRALNATRPPRFGRRFKPTTIRSHDVDDNSCSHAESSNCLGRFGIRRYESDH